MAGTRGKWQGSRRQERAGSEKGRWVVAGSGVQAGRERQVVAVKAEEACRQAGGKVGKTGTTVGQGWQAAVWEEVRTVRVINPPRIDRFLPPEEDRRLFCHAIIFIREDPS